MNSYNFRALCRDWSWLLPLVLGWGFGLAELPTPVWGQEEAMCQLRGLRIGLQVGWLCPWQRQDKHSSDKPQCLEPQGPKINVLFNNMREVSSRLS